MWSRLSIEAVSRLHTPVRVSREIPISDAAALLVTHQVPALLVCDGPRVVGVLGEHRALEVLLAHAQGPVDAFAEAPPTVVKEGATVQDARDAAAAAHARWLLLAAADGTPRGLIDVAALPHLAPEGSPELPDAVHTAFDRATDLMAVVDLGGRLVEVNAAALALVGLSRREALGRDFTQLPWWIHDAALQAQVAAGLRRAHEGLETLFSSQHPSPAGTMQEVQVSLQPLRGADGAVECVYVHGRDVTAQKAMERELALAQDSYRQLFERNKAVVLFVDPHDGAILAANAAAADFYGWPVATLRRMHIGDLNTATPAQVAAEMALAQREARTHFLFRHRTASGDLRDVEVHSGPLEREGKTILYSIVHDVTARRTAEREAALFRHALEQSPVSIVVTNREGLIQYVNPRFTQLTGFTPEEVTGRNPRVTQSGNTPLVVYKQLWDTILRGQTWQGDLQNKRKDGGLYWERVTIGPVRDEQGAIVNFVGVKEDITAQRELEARTRLMATFFANARDGVLVTTPDGFITEANEAFVQMTGLPRHGLLGRHLGTLGEHASVEAAAHFAAALSNDGAWSGEFTLRQGSDRRVVTQLALNAVRDVVGGISHLVGIYTDITRLKASETSLAALARTDALTGLPNRTAFTTAVEAALARRRRDGGLVAVGVIDLDHFKTVNDTLGHDAGDQLLQEVARRLRSALRETDTVGRLGGDEFVVLLEGGALDPGLEQPALRLLNTVAAPFDVSGRSLAPTISLGLALAGQHGLDPRALLVAADGAMYRAKASGGNRWLMAGPPG